MLKAEVFVDVCCRNLTSGDGADGAGRTGDAVAAGEDAVHVFVGESAVGEGADGTVETGTPAA